MSYDLSVAAQYSVGGKAFNLSQITISVPRLEPIEELIPVAKTFTLTTRTDANTGVLTFADATHGIATGNKVDLYWTNADGTLGRRRGVTVGTVAGAVVPIDLGAGDDLPIATTVVILALVRVFSMEIIGDNMAFLLGACDQAKGTIVLLGTGGTVELLNMPIAANGNYAWRLGDTNPLAGATVDTVHFSHADVNTARNMRVTAGLTV